MLPSPDTNILLVTAVGLAGWAEVPGAGGGAAEVPGAGGGAAEVPGAGRDAEVPGAGGAAGDMSGRTEPWSLG